VVSARITHGRKIALALGIFAALLAWGVAPAASLAASGCDKVASTRGSDGASGSESSPYRSARKLVDSLSPGQSGCLRGGTYYEDVTITRGGQPGSPVTLGSYPGERATLVGRLWVAGADFVVISSLNLDGRNSRDLPSPTVTANVVSFLENDITNQHTGICLMIGSDSDGHAAGTVIKRNRIHDCGRLPTTNHDHGIYAFAASDTTITDNLIYDNADRGVQLYPNAQRTIIRNNVIDGNGEGVLLAGRSGVASSGNLVESNVITNSRLRYNVESYWASNGPIGQGNVVRGNCVFGGALGNVQNPPLGFTAVDNVVADPRYVNRGTKDFRLGPGSCVGATPPATGARVRGLRLAVAVQRRQRLHRALSRGLRVRVACSAACVVDLSLARKRKRGRRKRSRRLREIGEGYGVLASGGRGEVVVELSPRAKRMLRHRRRVRTELRVEGWQLACCADRPVRVSRRITLARRR
jgi:parallel beta-helix repeat protein